MFNEAHILESGAEVGRVELKRGPHNGENRYMLWELNRTSSGTASERYLFLQEIDLGNHFHVNGKEEEFRCEFGVITFRTAPVDAEGKISGPVVVTILKVGDIITIPERIAHRVNGKVGSIMSSHCSRLYSDKDTVKCPVPD